MASIGLTEHPDIQGLLFRGYTDHAHAGYGLFRIRGRRAFQAWLAGLLDREQVTTAERSSRKEVADSHLNIAFTASGLQKLLDAGWIADSFEPAFIEGMVQEHRSRLLGDVEANDPKGWRWGRRQDFDGLLMGFAHSRQAADDLLAAHLTAANGADRGITVFGHLDGAGTETFGFADGISQPIVEGTKLYEDRLRTRPREVALHGVPVGEVLLGYPDGSGRLPRSPATSAASDPRGVLPPHWERPERRDLGRNGSFLVVRQMAQDKDGFWRLMEAMAAEGAGESAIGLAEKMVGRRKDGGALAPATGAGPAHNNLFDFDDDRQGQHCPLGSHIRRSNPRATGSDTPDGSLNVTKRHRMIRRGRGYTDDEQGEVGLQFLCFNASITRQFEFVQGSWCNNPFFHGLQREVDPIIGTVRPAGRGLASIDRFTIPRAGSYRRLLAGLPSFVTVKGGGYFFMPAIAALRCLAAAP